MKHNLEKTFLRFLYSLREYSNNTIILGAGCSLSSSKNDITFKGLMEKSLYAHGIYDAKEYEWDKLYREFINIAWEGKGIEEKELLLKKTFTDLSPSPGYMHLRSLVEKGYFSTIITTNVDMLLDDAFKGLSYRKRVGSKDYVVIGNAPTFDLIKVHGDIENGELRFSPDELMKLPEDLQDEIHKKTEGLLVVTGYKGQDNGLINSLNRNGMYGAYWVDLYELDICDAYTVKHILEFMKCRNSMSNFLHGKEYGDFDNLMRNIYNSIFLKDYSKSIISKENSIGQVWKHTTIAELLKLYNRLYELFLDILEISSIENEKMCEKYSEFSNIHYNEYLNSYLYFFNKHKLPANLLQIPNNELDALVLGISLDILVKSIYYKTNSDNLIKSIKTVFNSKSNHPLIDEKFWKAVEQVVSFDKVDKIKISIDMRNKLQIISQDIPLQDLNELVRVVNFLSLFIPIQENNDYFSGSIYKIRQLLSEKYENITFNDNKILINIGQMTYEDAEILTDIYMKNLPEIKRPSKKIVREQEWIILESKWIELQLIADLQLKSISKESDNFYSLCKERVTESTKNFMNMANPFGISTNVYVDLQLSNDIKLFTQSENSAMFIIGTSGRGKTAALQRFVGESILQSNSILSIVLTPKNSIIDRFGLDLFLNINATGLTSYDIIKNINASLGLRDEKLVLIFDGLNEISNIYEVQESHYKSFLELAKLIYTEKCDNIKLIITCRESAYYKYKVSTNLLLNPMYFFYDPNISSTKNMIEEYAYQISALSLIEKKDLMIQYGLNYEKMQTVTELSKLYSYIIDNDVTPLFIAIVGETIKSKTGVNLIENNGNVYDVFTNLMLERLGDANIYMAQKIIYTYFDLLIKYRKSDIEVTVFKLLENLPFEYHTAIKSVIIKMQDVNILVNDYSRLNRIKFSHDQIEEFFFKQYIIEFESNNQSFYENILELKQKNVKYRRGLLQYFQFLIFENKLAKFKELSLMLVLKDIDDIPIIIIEALSSIDILNTVLNFLLDENDMGASKKMYSILLLGIEKSLPTFSTLVFDLKKVVSMLLHHENKISSNSDKAFLCYAKSKIYYFKGCYEKSIKYIDFARDSLDDSSSSLKTTINILNSILLMEQGFSKQSTEILKKEFNKYIKLDDYQKITEIGIELGRALNHNGQIEEVQELYDFLLSDKRSIDNIYVSSKIYQRKANVLNRVMYHLLQYGTVSSNTICEEDLNSVEIFFEDAVILYNKSINMLKDINDMFTYTGVVPELINTYISFSFSIKETGIEKCEEIIEETDNLFKNITTPFKADFFLSKAYYYEYINEINKAEYYIEKALEFAQKHSIRNKIAKSNSFYAYFAYRCILKCSISENKRYWFEKGRECLEKAILYYEENTIVKDNIVLIDDIILKQKYEKLTI